MLHAVPRWEQSTDLSTVQRIRDFTSHMPAAIRDDAMAESRAETHLP